MGLLRQSFVGKPLGFDLGKQGHHQTQLKLGKVLPHHGHCRLHIGIIAAHHKAVCGLPRRIPVQVQSHVYVCLLFFDVPHIHSVITGWWLTVTHHRVFQGFVKSGDDVHKVAVDGFECPVIFVLCGNGVPAMDSKFRFNGGREKLHPNQIELGVLGVQDVVAEQLDHVEPLVTALAKNAVIKVVAVDVDTGSHDNPMHPIKNPPCSGFFALNETLQAAPGKGEL